jgi:hypothetical protein
MNGWGFSNLSFGNWSLCFGGAGFSLPIRAKLGLFFLRAAADSGTTHVRRLRGSRRIAAEFFGGAVGRVPRSITKAGPIVRLGDTAIWNRSTGRKRFGA